MRTVAGARSGSTRFWRQESAREGSKVKFNGFQTRFNGGPEKVPEKAWEALVQRQVRYNRFSEKVPENVLGDFGAGPGEVQGVQEEVPEKLAEKVLFLLFVCVHVHTGDLLYDCWGYHRSYYFIVRILS